MTTLVGFLGAAESPEFSSERRAQLTAIATRQATALRNLLKGRLMVIVAHDRSERYEPLKRAFVLDSEVEVILDRRLGRGAGSAAESSLERRPPDRRRQMIDDDLRRAGVALVRPASELNSDGRSFFTSSPPVAARRVSNENDPHGAPGDESSATRILIVDDDPGVIGVLSAFLQLDEGEYIVETASSGESGLAAVQRRRPDLVLLDINMPGLNGLELLKHIRRIDRGIPVIMVSGSTDLADFVDASQNGALAYIPKPFKFGYIKLLISTALEQRSARARPRASMMTTECARFSGRPSATHR